MTQRGFFVERDTEALLNYFEGLTDEDFAATQLENAEEFEFILIPPKHGVDCDRDDANSDDEQMENIGLLGKKLLAEPAEVRVNIGGNFVDLYETQHADSPVVKTNKNLNKSKTVKRKKIRNWTGKNLEQSSTNKLINNFRPVIANEIIEQDMSPLTLFKMIFSEEFINQIGSKTIKYARLKGDMSFTVTSDDIYKFIAILLLSGYSKLPSKRMYWEQQEDSYNILISNAMSRNKFEKILRFIHFNDNNNINPNNKLYKVQALRDHFNKMFLELAQPLGTNFSVDEAMEPYFGRSSIKQFIRGKPIRFGYKLWCLTSTNGYLLKFIPYKGKTERPDTFGLGWSQRCKTIIRRSHSSTFYGIYG